MLTKNFVENAQFFPGLRISLKIKYTSQKYTLSQYNLRIEPVCWIGTQFWMNYGFGYSTKILSFIAKNLLGLGFISHWVKVLFGDSLTVFISSLEESTVLKNYLKDTSYLSC